MKTIRTLLKSFLLLTLLMVAGGNSATAQTDSCAINVIHTYMNGRPIQWDSVEIRVCIPPCQSPYHYRTFMMYWPDTLLSNCPTGIDEYVPAKELGLSQNFPNPCQGKSSVKLTTRTSGNVTLQIMDMQGRGCCQRTTFLPAGEHLLSLRLPSSGFYLVNAQTANGSEVCKVLCSEGSGSDYDIEVMSSSSCQFVEKAGKGGEGQFNMTDKMRITAYITYNGSVLSKDEIVNFTFEDHLYISDSLYDFGSVNIYFLENDGCDSLTLSGKTFDLLVSSHNCQPFMDYPLGSIVTFSDTTFYSTPTALFPYFSSTWRFNGQYKYRYYPQFNNRLCIFPMDATLPPEDIESIDDIGTTNYWSRFLRFRTCDVILISQYSEMIGHFYDELMVRDEQNK